jgi:hypothetical protein
MLSSTMVQNLTLTSRCFDCSQLTSRWCQPPPPAAMNAHVPHCADTSVGRWAALGELRIVREVEEENEQWAVGCEKVRRGRRTTDRKCPPVAGDKDTRWISKSHGKHQYPFALDKAGEGLIYTCDSNRLPERLGVYVFCRVHGDFLDPLYIGKANNLRKRICQHFKGNVQLMKGFEDSEKTGKRVVVPGCWNSKSGQQQHKLLPMIERALIRYALTERHDLLIKWVLASPLTRPPCRATFVRFEVFHIQCSSTNRWTAPTSGEQRGSKMSV